MSDGGFTNSIVGSLGTLLRKAVRSPNYVSGSAGWTVNQDGTAEFQSLTARGNVTANKLVVSDPNGTTQVDVGGVTVYNSVGVIVAQLSYAKQILSSVIVNKTMDWLPHNAPQPSANTYLLQCADGVTWDPLGRAAGKPYLVFYDGSAWKAVSA